MGSLDTIRVDELGNILREAREARGLSLADVQQQLRITPRFLEALEQGHYHLLPSPVHVRGYLRNYARFLRLDPQPLLDHYEAHQAHYVAPVGAPAAPSAANPSTIYQRLPAATANDDESAFFNPVNLEMNPAGETGRTESWIRIVIIIALLIAIGLVASRFFVTDNRELNVVAVVQDLLRGEVEPDAGLPLGTPESGLAPTPTGTITSTSRNIAEGLPTVTPTPPALPDPLTIIELEITITERNWIQVRIDGEITYEGLARAGDQFIYTAQQEAYLKTANAIGTDITINGVRLGRLGGRAEVVERTWQTTAP